MAPSAAAAPAVGAGAGGWIGAAGGRGASGGGACRRRLRGWRQRGGGGIEDDGQVDHAARARRAGAANAERPQIVLGQVEHADDPRRQRQDDVRFLRLASVVREQPADERNVAQSRACLRRTRRSLSRMRPASRFVSPSCRRITVLISRLPKVGRPPNPVPEMLLTRILSASETWPS